MIIDCHCHIASPNVLPRQFFQGWSRTVRSNFPSTLNVTQEQRIDELLRELNEDADCIKMLAEMDRAGINKAVLLVIDFGLAYKDVTSSIEEIHLLHKKLLDQSDRFIGFSNVDPRRGKEGLDLFERAVREWGFKGMKLYAPCGYSPGDRCLFPYYEICSELHLPVLTHIGPTTATLSFRNSHPIDVDDAAFAFPNVNFILGHAAVMHYQEAALLAQYRPNIYLDLSGFQSAVNRQEFKEIMRSHIVRGLGRKLLFGTDWPIFRLWGSQRDWVAQIEGLHADGILNPDDVENIFSRNMLAILPPAGSEANHNARR
jgi:uncharacterized protein